MYKQLNPSDSNIEKLEINANHNLNDESEGLSFNKANKNSSNISPKTYWYTLNNLFYDNISYTSHYGQEKELHDECVIGSIGHKLFGEKIKPNTVYLENVSGSDTIRLQDDGKGNLYDSLIGTGSLKGNVFYQHGLFTITDTGSRYQYIGSGSNDIDFKSTQFIYQHSYLCEIDKNEMNASMNPTFSSGSEKIYDDMPTFITEVGLYDKENRLLAVGKMARPLWNDPEQSLSVEIQFDL